MQPMRIHWSTQKHLYIEYVEQCKSMQMVITLCCLGNDIQYRCEFFPQFFVSAADWMEEWGAARTQNADCKQGIKRLDKGILEAQKETKESCRELSKYERLHLIEGKTKSHRMQGQMSPTLSSSKVGELTQSNRKEFIGPTAA